MSNLADKLRESLLTCVICEDLYTDPRTLACLHSFCLICLRRWAENLRLENSIRCPSCRHVTQLSSNSSSSASGVNALPKSFLLENLRETVNTWEGSDVRRCMRCEVKAVCKSCDESLCEHCVQEHRIDLKSYSHKIVRLSEEALNDQLDFDSDDAEARSPERTEDGARWNLFRRSRSYDRAKIKSMFTRRSTSADRQAAVRRTVSPTLDVTSDRGSAGHTLPAPPTLQQSIPSAALTSSPTHIPIHSNLIITDTASPRNFLNTTNPGGDILHPSLPHNLSTSHLSNLAGPVDITRSLTRAHRSLPYHGATSSQWSYLARPQLKHTIRGNPHRPVWGVATLGRKIYVVTYCTPSVDIYDGITYGAIGSVSVDGLKDPWDLAACATHNCLFVCDWRNRAVFCIRLRADSTSTVTTLKWLQLEHHPRGLSVSPDGRTVMVICASWRGDVTYDSLRIYDTSAAKRPRLLKKIRLGGFDSVWQAVSIRTSSHGSQGGQAIQGEGYVVCYGGRLDRTHQVCRMDSQGRPKAKYGSEIGCGREQLNIPSSLVVDSLGQLLVADYNNSRIQLLSANSLRLQRSLLQRNDGVDKPRRLCLNEEKGDLYVGQDNGDVKIYTVSTPRQYNAIQ